VAKRRDGFIVGIAGLGIACHLETVGDRAGWFAGGLPVIGQLSRLVGRALTLKRRALTLKRRALTLKRRALTLKRSLVGDRALEDERRQCLYHRAVEHPQLRSKQAGVGGLLQELVLEGVAGAGQLGLLAHHLCPFQRRQVVRERRRVESGRSGHRLKELEREEAPADRCDLEDAACVGWEAIDARIQHPAQGARQGERRAVAGGLPATRRRVVYQRPLVDERADDLLDVEWVPAAA